MIRVEIICDSVSEAGSRLTTMVCTFPRFILSEFNTHRAFSRNSASSRAIPSSKLIKEVRENPVIPLFWGKNKSGMSASEELENVDNLIERWLLARDGAVRQAEELANLEVHKQTTNRLLEPFMWHTVVVTATDWNNFFSQRCSTFAQPEMEILANLMRERFNESTPNLIGEGEWHLPFIEDDERDFLSHVFSGIPTDYMLPLKSISVARCARVSFLNHFNKKSYRNDFNLYNKLKSGNHWSPFEHVATPSEELEYVGNFFGWKQYRKFFPNENIV